MAELVIAVLLLVLVERLRSRVSRTTLRRIVTGAGKAALAGIPIVAIPLAFSTPVPFGSSASARAPALAAGSRLTESKLAAILAAGVRTRKVPARLDPSLSVAAAAKPIIALNGCHLLHEGVRSKPCVYGDTSSHTSVVLFGDSHASAWFPALDLIGKQQHLRLVILTKEGCPPTEVNIAAWFRRGAPYLECRRWRHNAEAEIAALHPALVVVTTASYLEESEARPISGSPTGYGSTWLNGWAATFNFLRRSSGHVIFISDMPQLGENVPTCVSEHMSDVRPCTVARSAAIPVPITRAREIKLAEHEHIDWIDPTSWFCDRTTCPVIVGSILLYRDNAHMTPPWSRFIAPVVADAILPILRSKPSAIPAG
ncbi:MAG: SGNH hydrolase domain-containing protein [Solirubrobacteraceae bacterium]